MLCQTQPDKSELSVELLHERVAHPIHGWPLRTLVRLDQTGARGLVADLTLAGALRRQAAFTACACADLDDPTDWLARLGVHEVSTAQVGIVLRTSPVRDLIAATFNVAPTEVPVRFLNALERVREVEAEPGMQPIENPRAYRRLWTIMTADARDGRARALSALASLSTASLEAVERLDPLLRHPEIITAMTTAGKINDANGLLDLLRVTRPQLSDEQITRGLRQSLKAGKSHWSYLRKAIIRAERLPEPPIPAAKDFRPLTTAAELKEFGLRMRNCAADKVADVALGLCAIYEVTHRAQDGTETTLAVELTPLTGAWMVDQIKMKDNCRPRRHVVQAVCDRLRSMGVLIPGPSPASSYTKSMARHLDVYWHDGLEDGDLSHKIWDRLELTDDEPDQRASPGC